MRMHIPSYRAGRIVRAIVQRAMVSVSALCIAYVLYVGLWILHNGK